ncbi:hypothetical protein [Fibrella musci]|uniref:hypothetical protein n=1 Tax=Fibrella musci TaxID=3242485 RepID=UPI0035217234
MSKSLSIIFILICVISCKENNNSIMPSEPFEGLTSISGVLKFQSRDHFNSFVLSKNSISKEVVSQLENTFQFKTYNSYQSDQIAKSTPFSARYYGAFSCAINKDGMVVIDDTLYQFTSNVLKATPVGKSSNIIPNVKKLSNNETDNITTYEFKELNETTLDKRARGGVGTYTLQSPIIGTGYNDENKHYYSVDLIGKVANSFYTMDLTIRSLWIKKAAGVVYYNNTATVQGNLTFLYHYCPTSSGPCIDTYYPVPVNIGPYVTATAPAAYVTHNLIGYSGTSRGALTHSFTGNMNYNVTFTDGLQLPLSENIQ